MPKAETEKYNKLYKQVKGVLDGGGEVFIEVADPGGYRDPADEVKQALKKRARKDKSTIETETFRGDGLDTLVVNK